MEFCAWMQVYLADRWYTFAPRNNTRRIGHIVIGRGRNSSRGSSSVQSLALKYIQPPSLSKPSSILRVSRGFQHRFDHYIRCTTLPLHCEIGDARRELRAIGQRFAGRIALASTRIQRITQGVAEEVEANDGCEDGSTGKHK